MGSFNVSCSVSSLSIGSGEEAYFIPLLPRQAGKVHEVGANRFLTYPNAYYNPFCLPIKGKYGDCGRLGKAARSESVEAVERFFGIGIDAFLNCAGAGHSWADAGGPLCEAMVGAFTLLCDRTVSFGASFLEALGFFKRDDGLFAFGGFGAFADIDENRGEYRIRGEDGGVLVSRRGGNLKRTFMEDFQRFTGRYLSVPGDKQSAIAVLESMSGMFVHADVYSRLADFGLRQAGALGCPVTFGAMSVFGFSLKEEDRFGEFSLWEKEGAPSVTLSGEGAEIAGLPGGFYSIASFAKTWAKQTGEELDLAPFGGESAYGHEYDELRGKVSRLKPKIESLRARILSCDNQTEKDKLWEKLMDLEADLPFRSHLGPRSAFLEHFREWRHFKSLYEAPIMDGKLKADFAKYLAFHDAMHSANRFYFPSCVGEQQGNNEASKALLEASLGVIGARIRLRG